MFNTLTRMGASQPSGYTIDKAIRIDDDSGNYLNRTPSSGGDRRTWTFSCWVKRGDVSGSASTHIFSRGTTAGGDWFFLYFNADGHLQPYFYEAYGPQNLASESKGQMRDPAAWYHIVLRIDTTQSTQSNRMRLYINGVEDVWNNYNGLQQDYQYEVNETSEHRLGRAGHGDNFDGYLAEIHFLDGQSLDASNFGEFDSDTGQWIPKEYTGGNYGTNGFYLDFSDNSNTTATTLGKDSSGQGNNWTPHNFSVAAGDGNDSVTDTPTNNHCVLNPLYQYDISAGASTYSNANLDCVLATQSGAKGKTASTFELSSGKWYWECKYVAQSGSGNHLGVGLANANSTRPMIDGKAWYYYGNTNRQYFNDAGSVTEDTTLGVSVTTGDTFSVALDLDNGKWYVGKNNTWINSGDPGNGTGFVHDNVTGTVIPVFSNTTGSSTQTISVNFGQKGFAYTPPAGFNPVCVDDLSDPTIKDPGKFFNTGIYTGNGTADRAITGVGFQPDKVVVKVRDVTDKSFQTYDSVRGANKTMHWNELAAESTSTDRVMSFDSDGFTLGDNNTVNQDTKKFVYWAWKESATAGFDMVGYSGNGTDGRTISHSLGVIPEMMITKRRTDSDPWAVYHKNMDADEYVMLNSVDDDENVKNYYSGTRPTSSVFTLGDNNGTNGSGQDYITYLWSSVKGFSKVGQYEGNNNNDGFFLYLGFRPAFFLVKNTNDNETWGVYDDARGANQNNPYLSTTGYNNGYELTDRDLDINSNGIKFRWGHNMINYEESGAGYIYLAMARSPFKYANGK